MLGRFTVEMEPIDIKEGVGKEGRKRKGRKIRMARMILAFVSGGVNCKETLQREKVSDGNGGSWSALVE